MGVRGLGAAWLAGACALAMPTPAAAQATDQAEAQVIVVSPLSLINVQGLNFGNIVPTGTAGQVRLWPDGSRTYTGGVVPVGSVHHEARFAGMGVYNQQVRIRLGANSIQITGPGTPMTVNNFEIGSTPNTVILGTGWSYFSLGSATGQYNFGLGGTLAVGANQTPGQYSGTFLLELQYQ